MRTLASVAKIVVLGISLGVLGWAQAVSTSQINGTVQDASGAVLPGAEIAATQTDTGAVRKTISNETGAYVLPNLPVGPYKLEVSLPGFRTFVQSGIILQVNSSPVVNAVLAVGQVSETVEVQANAAMVETRSSGIGQVIENARILELPLIGRQVTDLVVLSGAAFNAGTAPVGNRQTYPNVSSFSIAGGLSAGNIFTLDGGFHNDVTAGMGLPLPFPDALQEFKVETSSLPAQYGYHSGGAITALTKSGTNEWHGSLFEFVRNYALNARTFFATSQDGLKRNQWGGTVGAPIKKNKLFFFAGFQGTNTRQTPSNSIAFLPTQAMLSGDFTAITSPACNSGRQINLRAPFVSNRISPSQLSVPAVNITKLLPASTDQCGQVNYGRPVSSDESFGIGKVDYQIKSTHTVFVRYLGTEFDQKVPYSITKNALASTLPGASDLVQSVTLGDTYLFGSSVVNSFRATFNRGAFLRVPAEYFGPEDVGINVLNYVPHFLQVAITGGFNLGGGSAGRNHGKNVVGQLSDDAGFTRGNHQMAFGASLMGFQQVSHGTTYAPPLFTITGSATGLGLADFMTGQTASLTQGAPTHTKLEGYYLGLYAQDSWRVKPGLTVSYGLRWEPYFPAQQGILGPSGENEHFDMSGFLQGIRSKVFVKAPPGLYFPGDALYGPNGSSGINKSWNHFAPRVGIVWDPTKSDNTVIRAGYGIFFEQIPTLEFGVTSQSPPWGGKVNLLSVPGGLANPYAGQPDGNPFPFVLDSNTPFPPYGTFDTFNANTQIPYVQQWNFGIQRQIGNDWLVSVSYIGNEVTHLYGMRELNPATFVPGNCSAGQYGLTAPGPCSTTANTNERRLLTQLNPTEGTKYGFVDVWDDGGTRNYHGLLLDTQKRVSHGFTLTANYTWSHCISNLVNSFPQTGAGGSGLYFAPTRKGDRGNCTVSGSDVNNGGGTDRRHIANMSGIATMPTFSNKTLRMIASDWRPSATVSMYSGGPFVVVTGTDDARNGINAVTQYANQVLPNIYGNGLPGSGANAHWLNPAAFARPAPGTQANMAPGSVRGPGALIFNAGLSRLFPIRERQNLELRAEAQNVLNRANFSDPTANLSSNTFGQIISTGPARIMQFALKYSF